MLDRFRLCPGRRGETMNSVEVERRAGQTLWDVRDVAQYLKASVSWVYKAAERGELAAKERHRDAARSSVRAPPHRREGRGPPPRARANGRGAGVREPCARQAADCVLQGEESWALGRAKSDPRDGAAARSQARAS